MKEWFRENGLKLILGVFTLIGTFNLGEAYKVYKEYNHKESQNESMSNKELSIQFLELKDDYNAYKILKEREINELQNEISRLKNNVILLEFAGKDTPSWIKDRNSVMIGVSEAYVSNILKREGIALEEFIGTTGEGIFPDSIVHEWIKHDEMVMRQNHAVASVEMIPNGTKGLSLKFPLKTKYGGIIGTSGIWIDEKYLKEVTEIFE